MICLFIGFLGRWNHFWHLFGYLTAVIAQKEAAWGRQITCGNSISQKMRVGPPPHTHPSNAPNPASPLMLWFSPKLIISRSSKGADSLTNLKGTGTVAQKVSWKYLKKKVGSYLLHVILCWKSMYVWIYLPQFAPFEFLNICSPGMSSKSHD